MKLKLQSIILFFLLSFITNAQYSWQTITPSHGSFSFKMPGQPVIVDTLQNMLFSFEIDSALILQTYYTETDSAFGTFEPNDTMHNPLYLYTANLLLTTTGQLEEIDNLNPSGTLFQGKQVGISYFTPDSVKIFLFTRFYFDGQNMLTFIVSAPENMITDLIAIKDSFFNYIVLN